ncbi:MAG TPA: peroxiredoxin [Gemmataceae bacterium]|nr:peroxiredoxin [Gemmataceae bacterium]
MKSCKVAGITALCIAALLAGKLWAAEDQKVDLKVGDQAPQFDATDDQGNAWKSTDHVGKKVLVVYFYPADLTGGCTKQACGFRDDAKELTEKGVEVVGISGDSVSNHQLFKKVHSLPFTLLADEEGTVAKKFGVPLKQGGVFNFKDADGQQHQLTRGVTASRWTFVIGKDGKILFKNTKVDAPKDSKAILALIEKQEK